MRIIEMWVDIKVPQAKKTEISNVEQEIGDDLAMSRFLHKQERAPGTPNC